MAKVTGIVQVKINGTRLRVEGKPTIDVGGEEREAVIGDAVHGFRSTITPSIVTANVAHMSDTVIDDIRGFEDVTVEWISDTGPTYAQTPATLTNSVVITDGIMELTFQGAPITDV